MPIFLTKESPNPTQNVLQDASCLTKKFYCLFFSVCFSGLFFLSVVVRSCSHSFVSYSACPGFSSLAFLYASRNSICDFAISWSVIAFVFLLHSVNIIMSEMTYDASIAAMIMTNNVVGPVLS